MSIELELKKLKGKIVSAVRKITKVYPLDSPAMAMVFRWNMGDTPEMRRGVFDLIRNYGATASFVVTGDIVDNDAEFIRTAIDAGCELISGGFTGQPFSARKLKAPAGVVQLNGYDAVLRDATKLHEILKDDFGYTMKAGMPPYGVEHIDTAVSVYDLYDVMDYQYVAGSDIIEKGQETKLSQALKNGGLNGHVAVLDVCDPAALKVQIDALADAGYGVCTVSELLAVSPFSDIGANDPCFEPAVRLLEKGHPVAMRNNCLVTRPFESIGDTLTTILPKEDRTAKLSYIREHKTMMGRYSVYNPYCAVIFWAKSKDNRVKFDFPTTSGLFRRVLHDAGFPVDIGKYRVQYRRSEIIRILADVLCATEEQDPYGVFDEHLTPIQRDLRDAIGEEEFNKIKEEIEARHAAEAAANEEQKDEKEEKGTILDRFEKKRANKAASDESEAGKPSEDAPEVNKDQIVL